MKKLFFTFFTLCLSMSAVAEKVKVGALYYDLNYSDNTAEVTYQSSVSNSYSSYTSVHIPETIYYDGTTYSVTSIGDHTFSNCTKCKFVIISNSVTSIGDYAFYNCYSLTSVTIGNSVTSIGGAAFSSCSKLTSINIPNSVTIIGNYAFSGCSALTSITIPNSVTSIGMSAFEDCSALTSVTISNSVTSIGIGAFDDCFSLSKTNYTGDVAGWCDIKFGSSSANPMYYSHNFYINDQEMKDLVIPNTIDSIHDYAFYNCSSLTSVTIGNSVTSIGGVAFSGCSKLTSIIIPNSVTIIGHSAFSGCSSLASITIPKSVTSIGQSAFSSCSSLTSVVWNAKNGAELGYASESYSPFYYICTQITSFTFGDSVEYIPEYLCYGMRNLTSITIPNSVTSIENVAFYNCSSLTSVTIPNSVTSIGNSAFVRCSSLTSITIPNSVTRIGSQAFYACSSLDTLTCLAMIPPALRENVFYGCDNPTLYVPCAALPDYQSHTKWSELANIECINVDEVTTDGVTVTPTTNDVTIIWPTESSADSYTIIVKKGDEVFCKLTFNSKGQLVSIAFAPGRYGSHPAQYAAQTVGGYRFTITGLTEGTQYTYNITTKDASDKTLTTYTGEFTTKSSTPLGASNVLSPTFDARKLIHNGQLIIIRDGVEYNAQGVKL